MTHRLRLALSLLALLHLLQAGVLRAQQVRGTVMEAQGGAALSGAVVTLSDADGGVRAATLTDEAGAFLLRAAVGIDLQLRVQRIGYAPLASVPIIFAATDSVFLEIRMQPQPIALEGVTATTINRNLEHFLREQAMGFGIYLGPAELAQIDPKSTSHLLVSMRSSPLLLSPSGLRLLARTRQRNRAPGMPPNTCVPRIYVDGLEVREEARASRGSTSSAVPGARSIIVEDRGIALESVVRAGAVRGVAVYKNPANAPAEFQQSFLRSRIPDCPIVLIWTTHSFGSDPGTR